LTASIDGRESRMVSSHEIEKLVKTGMLTAQRDADAAADPNLEANWLVVKDWN
jgi:hypothetical protein